MSLPILAILEQADLPFGTLQFKFQLRYSPLIKVKLSQTHFRYFVIIHPETLLRQLTTTGK